MSPLQKAIEEVKEIEMKDLKTGLKTGLVRIEEVIKILEQFEVDTLNQPKTNY